MEAVNALFGERKYNSMQTKNVLNAVETKLKGVIIVEPVVFGDNRGWFYETYSKAKYEQLGIGCDFVQDNRSFSAKKGTLRGLHCQLAPKAQAKLVSCTAGALVDVAVDLRSGSPTYLQWIAVELTAENKRQLFLPKGFLHGFVTLSDNTEITYKADNYFCSELDRTVRYDDSQIGVVWPFAAEVMSDKDKNAPYLADSDVHFE